MGGDSDDSDDSGEALSEAVARADRERSEHEREWRRCDPPGAGLLALAQVLAVAQPAAAP